ncbi:MAG: HEPN domain-containing protein [Dethiobacter sp.]|jgi:HEPN domain-containing protein|nr:HEPN domain-containing protein [Dethiobacter sp.]
MRLFDMDEFIRWLKQARHTLSSAERDMFAGDYAWSCFKSQQSAEFALKALVRGAGRFAGGHSTLKLYEVLRDTGFEIPEHLPKWCRDLDRHYIPPRYPDAYPAGSPFEYYDRDTAEQALIFAERVVRYAEEVAASAESD